MIIPIDAEKASDKIKHTFIIKKLSRVVIEGDHSQVDQDSTKKNHTANTLVKISKFLYKDQVQDKDAPPLTTPFQHHTGSPS